MLLDTTLREGEQSFGIYIDTATKRNIIETLARAGIEEMEIGYAGQETLPELLAHARSVAPEMECSVWCRCHEADIHKVAALGVRRISIGVPVSHAHITTRLRTTVTKLEERLADVLHLAKTCGISYISLGLEDCSRADRGTALRLAMHGIAHGASRIRLSDTVGILTPAQTAQLVSFFRANLPEAAHIATHFHNDFGMATANAITALEHGADSTDVSILGLGERAGIAKLEEVAAVISLNRNFAVADQKTYDLSALRKLAIAIGNQTDLTVKRNAPVIGSEIFSVESGIHADGLVKAPALFEPFPPELIHAKRDIRLGRKTGAAAVAHAAQEMGCDLPANKLGALVEQVRMLSIRQNRALTNEEFLILCRSLEECRA